jgi:hypothetical protein
MSLARHTRPAREMEAIAPQIDRHRTEIIRFPGIEFLPFGLK